jgi:hypothetical protein
MEILVFYIIPLLIIIGLIALIIKNEKVADKFGIKSYVVIGIIILGALVPVINIILAIVLTFYGAVEGAFNDILVIHKD